MGYAAREAHPRPDFIRRDWMDLNGKWQFAFDDADEGLKNGWFAPEHGLPLRIQVPFAYQTKRSGLGPTDEIHPILWYRRSFKLEKWMEGRKILARFGAVDERCAVYVNGYQVGTHKGGYLPFSFDITPYLQAGENDLCLRVVDDPDFSHLRGKQYWERGLMGCWYTPVSGIWQSVYLEAAGQLRVEHVMFRPDIDRHLCAMELTMNAMPKEPAEAEIRVSFAGQPVRTVRVNLTDRISFVPIDLAVHGALESVHLWGPGHPDLYDAEIRILQNDQVCDEVLTYFGMRHIEVRDGRVYLNHQPLYQRLILDQGYWPDSLITPPDGEALKTDVEWTLKLGYNGARKHQKLEDPRYYYWADKLGLLVWGEIPSAYAFSSEVVSQLTSTLEGFIRRDFNHPSIITWVPLNESWGVREIYHERIQQEAARTLYHLTKAMDGTRLCSGNDGWEQVETDICALHDYAAEGKIIAKHFVSREEVEKHSCDWRPCYAEGVRPTGQEAFMVTEYGGIAFQNQGIQGRMGGMETWGYHDKVADETAYLARFRSVTDAIREIPYCVGYCYTQLTDVMQEINGVLTPDRKCKVDPEAFAAMNRNPEGIPGE